MPRKKVNLPFIYEKKAKGENFPGLVLYDCPMAVLAELAELKLSTSAIRSRT